ncbi:MAG: hypothetical protein OEQ53_07045 [Saprospiraceae bacterium]|nr:hypothetical protein [Saprospiraceae bacterium]
MIKQNTRRRFIGQSAASAFALTSTPFWMSSKPIRIPEIDPENRAIGPEFPSQSAEDVRTVVGASHTQFDKVKELVTARPELAKAAWDWGFGDWESALGAASHMGRRDIAEFLIAHGARPNIYTFAMLGNLAAVKGMVETMPGVQRIHGPHGFPLLHHAQIRLRYDDVSPQEKANVEAVIDYLKSLGDADNRATSLDISEEEQKMYMGSYTFGDLPDEVFLIDLNRRGMLYMSRGENIGRVLNRVAENAFAPSGAPSVRINFDMKDGQAVALTIHDPDPLVKALRVEG